MKQQLELKHIAPYLPFKLQGTAKHKKDILCSLTGLGRRLGKTVDVEIKKGLSFLNVSFGLSNFKPILRPLSDLTKEITHEGETFVPAKILFQVSAEEEENFDLYGEIPDYWKRSIRLGTDYWSHWQVKLAYEYKFAIDIPEGTWIDVNTLKDNPYE